MVSQKITESEVQKACCDFLAAKRVMFFRMNAGDRFGETNGRKWRIKGHEPGTADLLALINTGVPLFETMTRVTTDELKSDNMAAVWIEVKSPGKKQRPEQIEFQKRVEEYGCTYLLIDSIDALMQWFEKRGL